MPTPCVVAAAALSSGPGALAPTRNYNPDCASNSAAGYVCPYKAGETHKSNNFAVHVKDGRVALRRPRTCSRDDRRRCRCRCRRRWHCRRWHCRRCHRCHRRRRSLDALRTQPPRLRTRFVRLLSVWTAGLALAGPVLVGLRRGSSRSSCLVAWASPGSPAPALASSARDVLVAGRGLSARSCLVAWASPGHRCTEQPFGAQHAAAQTSFISHFSPFAPPGVAA